MTPHPHSTRQVDLPESQPSTPSEPTVSSHPHSTRQVDLPESFNATETCVLASRSQMHPQYADSRNSQCTCNSASFLAFLHESHHLQSTDLDLVLDRGHAMYALILDQLIADGQQVNAYLNTDELPEIVFGYRQQHIMTKCESMFGMFTTPTGEEQNPNLLHRLQCLSSGVSYALLIMASLCIAVFRDQQGRYGFFDPHSRGPDGLPHDPDGTGTAVMFVFTDLSDLITKLQTYFTLLGVGPSTAYHLMPVRFDSVDEVDEVSVGESADIAVSNTFSQTEITMPSCSVTEFPPCSDITSDANGLMHDRSNEVALECPSLDTLKCDLKHMPNLSKIQKDHRKKVNRRVKASEKKTPTCVKNAQQIRRKEMQKTKRNAHQRERYNKNASVTNKSCGNELYRKRKMSYITARYKQNRAFKKKQKSYITARYKQDRDFKKKQKSYITTRYSQDSGFKKKQKSCINNSYANDRDFKSKHKQRMRLYQVKVRSRMTNNDTIT